MLRGAALYNGAQGCQNCHGAGGKGDGPTAASLTCKVPDLTNPTTARPFTLSAWFTITTIGNGQTQGCLMPSWKARLTEQQRWDVSAFMYSLHYKPAQLTEGKTLWAENCAACHGEKGAGDGPRAKDSARPIPNLADSRYIITKSDEALFKVVTNGLGANMPAFPNLTESQRWAVVAHSRSLSWAETVNPAAANQPLPRSADEKLISVTSGRLLLDVAAETVMIQQAFSFVNTSTQFAYFATDGSSVRVTLPTGASSVILDVESRNLFTLQESVNLSLAPTGNAPKVYTLVSNSPINPGETRAVLITYTLPKQVPLKFVQPFRYPVESMVVYLSDESGLAVSDELFAVGGNINLTNGQGRVTDYRSYERVAPILAGLPIEFTLDEQRKLADNEATQRRNTLLGVALFSLLSFAVIGVGVWRISWTG
jgi:mono/diheme cytochrome c family protein